MKHLRLCCTLTLLLVFFLTASRAHAQIALTEAWVRLGDSTGEIGEENGVASVEAAEFSPDGAMILSGAKRGGDVVLWTADGEELWRRYHANRAEVEVVAFTNDNQYAVSGGEDGFVRVWRVSDGAAVQAFTLGGSGANVSFDGMRFSNDGTRLATGDERGQLSLWDTSDPDPANWPTTPLVTVFQGPDQDRAGGGSGHADINSIDWTSDDAFLVTAGRDATVKRWEVAALSAPQGGLVETYTGFQNSIKSVRLSPDETLVAAGGQDSPEGLVLVWDFASGQVVERIDYTTNRKIEAVEWTPNGRFLLTGGVEGRDEPPYPDNGGFGPIRAYDAEDAFALVLAEETFRQEYFHFNADGSLLVSSHEDGTLRLWDVSYGGGNAETTYPAEDAALGGGATVDANHAGYRGSGFVNFPPDGGFAAFTGVDGGSGGTATLAFRYAHGGTSSRTVELRVNGEPQTLTFAPTGSWSSWSVLERTVTLAAGAGNTLRLTSTGEDGPNLDELRVTTGGAAFPQAGVWYTLANETAGAYLGSEADGSVNTAPACCSDGQAWRFVEAGDGSYYIDNQAPGRGSLDTDPGGVIEWVGEGSSNGDRWTVEAAGDGSYRFRSAASGRAYLYAAAGGVVRWNTGATDATTHWTPAAQNGHAAARQAAVAQQASGGPHEYALAGSHPNPFSEVATLRYVLAETARVRLEVYDVLGRRVVTLVDERQPAGPHAARFHADGLPSGAYVARLSVRAGERRFTQAQTMLLVK